jgi:hypothetical protein
MRLAAFRKPMRILVLCNVLGACGAGSGNVNSGGSQPPTATNAAVSGPFEFALTSTRGVTPGLIEVNFSQQGTAITDFTPTNYEGLGNSADYPSPPPASPNNIGGCADGYGSLVGTVNGEQITLTQSGANAFGDFTPAGASFSMTGTVSSDNSTITGTYSGYNPTSGQTASTGCVEDQGTFVAQKIASPNGTFAGTFKSANQLLPINATATVTTDQGLNVSTNVTLTNSSCFQQLALAGSQTGKTIILANSFITVEGFMNQGATQMQLVYYVVGTCGNDSGTGTLTLQ